MSEAVLREAIVRAHEGTPPPGVLYLSLMHPDFLAPIYSVAQVLTDEGYVVRVVSFDSPAPGRFPPGAGIQMSGCGAYGGSLRQRARARARFRQAVQTLVESQRPSVVITACPFSYLEALRLVPKRTPIIYHAFETYPASVKEFRHSPLTTLRNWRALRRLDRAALVCTPSPERSGWLMAYARLRDLPATVLNVPSWRETSRDDQADNAEPVSLPAHVSGKHIAINTGSVNATQATLELVESVALWPADACLLITNVGDTSYARAIREARDRSPRRDDIILLPLVSRAAMRWLQARAMIGICLMRTTSSLEAIMPAPNKVGEYLHSGLMLVGNRTSYLDRLDAHGIVEIAERLEPRSIAAAMTAAVSRVRRGDTKARVQALAQASYCMEVQIRPILSIVQAASPAAARR